MLAVPTVLTITQVNTYIKSIIDGDKNLSGVFLCGEISNFTNHYRTGHFYLTLKDDTSKIRAVMFRTYAQRLKFLPQDGMKVLVRGRISVYDRDGQYQVYIEDMQPDGAGALNLAYEQLKTRLEAEGLFDPSHKRPVPKFPQRIGVVTSPTGAAVHDICTVIGRRYPLAQIVLCPVQVQGDSAAPQICQAIAQFNMQKAADVLIVGRGGGSIEELWAFNEECVARAVYGSQIPVISAVGHETDFTICDFVADLRAPTPSAAGELAVPDARELSAFLFNAKAMLANALLTKIKERRSRFELLCNTPVLKNPHALLDSRRQVLDQNALNLIQAQQVLLKNQRQRLSLLCGKLHALSPLAVLSRGYSAVFNTDGKLITKTENVQPGAQLTVHVTNGSIFCTVDDVKRNKKGT